jgi:glutathione S-transferase
MLTLFDNPFSPFARKVRMVLHFKGLEFESIDALALNEHDRLVAVNPRAEVPVLVDRGFTVTDSTDIVYYLEDRHPTPAVFPVEPQLRAKARRSQRVADTLLDAIIHDVSIWTWPAHKRPDKPRLLTGCARRAVRTYSRFLPRSRMRSIPRVSCAAIFGAQAAADSKFKRPFGFAPQAT